MRKKLRVPLLVDDRGYVLYANPDGTYTMGCREKFTPERCFRHWGRDYRRRSSATFGSDTGSYWENRRNRAAKIRKAVRDHQRGLPVKFLVQGRAPFCLALEDADLTGVSFPKRFNFKNNLHHDMFIDGCHFNGEELVLPANIEGLTINCLTTTQDEICVVIGKHTKIDWEQ